jgi:hypothetical protein
MSKGNQFTGVAGVAVMVRRDGRECCQNNKSGRAEYRWRTLEMLERQRGLCCLCGLPLKPADATFDHEHGRGMGGGKRDDRISLPDGTTQNGAAHGHCNFRKGSRYVAYFRSLQQ